MLSSAVKVQPTSTNASLCRLRSAGSFIIYPFARTHCMLRIEKKRTKSKSLHSRLSVLGSHSTICSTLSHRSRTDASDQCKLCLSWNCLFGRMHSKSSPHTRNENRKLLPSRKSSFPRNSNSIWIGWLFFGSSKMKKQLNVFLTFRIYRLLPVICQKPRTHTHAHNREKSPYETHQSGSAQTMIRLRASSNWAGEWTEFSTDFNSLWVWQGDPARIQNLFAFCLCRSHTPIRNLLVRHWMSFSSRAPNAVNSKPWNSFAH